MICTNRLSEDHWSILQDRDHAIAFAKEQAFNPFIAENWYRVVPTQLEQSQVIADSYPPSNFLCRVEELF